MRHNKILVPEDTDGQISVTSGIILYYEASNLKSKSKVLYVYKKLLICNPTK